MTSRSLCVAALLLQVPPRQRPRSRCSRSDNFGGQRVVSQRCDPEPRKQRLQRSRVVRDRPRRQLAIVRRRLFPRPVRDAAARRYPSLREIGLEQFACHRRGSSAVGARRPARRNGGWGGGARAILYANSDFRGDRYVSKAMHMPRSRQHRLQRSRAIAARRARLLDLLQRCGLPGHVPNVRPGQLSDLPRGLDNRISSGRRISNDYPYNGRPNWDAE